MAICLCHGGIYELFIRCSWPQPKKHSMATSCGEVKPPNCGSVW